MIHEPSHIASQGAPTQTARAVLSLRDMIASGALQPDSRYTDVQLAELLSMSRTPIRAALQRLVAEGVLTAMPAGGYQVRRFHPVEISEAIEIRGMLEGLAVRLLAERGIAAEALGRLIDIADQIEAALLEQPFTNSAILTYARLNAAFHATLLAATGSQLLEEEIERANARPFASASALVGMHDPGRHAQLHLWVGQDQHRSLIEAIRNRQGARAEEIMREHARLSQRNLSRAVASERLPADMPGANLILQYEKNGQPEGSGQP